VANPKLLTPSQAARRLCLLPWNLGQLGPSRIRTNSGTAYLAEEVEKLLTVGHVAKRLGVSYQAVRADDVSLPAPARWVGRTPLYDAEDFDRLMTRKQVARLLRKSVTAVRMIEGTLLDFQEGPEGVHLFDRNHVEALSGKPLGRAAHSDWLKSRLARAPERRPRSNPQPIDASRTGAPKEANDRSEFIPADVAELAGQVLGELAAFIRASARAGPLVRLWLARTSEFDRLGDLMERLDMLADGE
jgi:hypothetical protein